MKYPCEFCGAFIVKLKEPKLVITEDPMGEEIRHHYEYICLNEQKNHLIESFNK